MYAGGAPGFFDTETLSNGMPVSFFRFGANGTYGEADARVLDTATQFTFSTWLKPNAFEGASTWIAGNQSGSSGFKLAMSSSSHSAEQGFVELALGDLLNTSYRNAMIGPEPGIAPISSLVAYFRLSEACSGGSTVTLANKVDPGRPATATGILCGKQGALFGEGDPAVEIPGGSSSILVTGGGLLDVATNAVANLSDGAVELWIRPRESALKRDLFSTNYGSNYNRIALQLDETERLILSVNGSTTTNAEVRISDPDQSILQPFQWHHIVVTWQSSIKKVVVYIDGKLAHQQTYTNWPSNLAGGGPSFGFGRVMNAGENPYVGEMDEIAIYKTTMSSFMVSDHYKLARRCGTRFALPSDSWSQVTGSYDGSRIQLAVNGQPHCDVSVSSAQIDSGAPIFLGSSPDNLLPWGGSLSTFKVFKNVGHNAKALFEQTANNYRGQPLQEAFIKDNLVLHFDPFLANQGMSEFLSGVALSPGSRWFDLSPNGINGTFMGFADSIKPVFYNDGVAHALKLDGVNDRVLLGNPAALNLSQGTLEFWVNISGTTDGGFLIHKQGAFGLAIDSADTSVDIVSYEGGTEVGYDTAATVPRTGWHQVALAWDDTSGTARVYVDGTRKEEFAFRSVVNNLANNFFIGYGKLGASNGHFGGKISAALIYSVPLTDTDVARNFSALGMRYGGQNSF